jgi:hypothetical protein
MDNRFKWTWNVDTKTLYIETENIETIQESADVNGVKF